MKAMTDLMYELKEILRRHAQRYPLMQPTDAVKLIYQNEFGGGHLIRDEESCLRYLQMEHGSIVKDPNGPRYEQIGNGIVRVNLAAVPEGELDQLGRSFIRSAAAHVGCVECFLRKLEILREMTAEGVFSFGSEELESYLADYARAGYPMVSHSEVYRRNYHPAYRVVMEELLN